MGNRKLTVALTFDFDAESYWMGTAKMDLPAAISRGTYGATEGVPRILTLLEKYNLPATFFVPGYNRGPSPPAANGRMTHSAYTEARWRLVRAYA